MNIESQDLYGRVGNLNKYQGRKILFDKIILHPSFNGTLYLYDIAVLLLNKPIELSANIQPAPLVIVGPRFTSGYAIIVGWGDIEKDNETAYLHSAEVRLVNPKRKWMNSPGIKTTGQEILTATPGVALLNGDSGSPLIKYDYSGQHVVIGVLSGSYAVANDAFIYMSTSVHHDFIASNCRGVIVYHVFNG
ncbi:suppressor of tumorigenicity 14 protein homolog [Centruroides sculpturatus]|uniref:suppressor of tumorigenicity 14 protein homolog n=1 Tax=Centruroides sculpturatus TaxID=218467 RepID=UPI000C6E9E0E|nr:suppressor of tumorigenicity 14 protein homolog [Centruroides sculpturatus]